MRAMILAAGRGQRMQHLTSDMPKALLRVNDYHLIEYPLYSLKKLGIKEVVINVCYQAEKIKSALGNGSRYGMDIVYSDEPEALETGGGVFQALPLLGSDPFIVLSCDVVSDYPLQKLLIDPDQLAHLVLVDNPDFHPRGDFSLSGNRVSMNGGQTYTFANIGLYRPELFSECKPGKFRLGDLLKQAILSETVSGEHYQGFWRNLGTPAQLEDMAALPGILL